MKKNSYILIFLINLTVSSQQQMLVKSFPSTTKEIEILTDGLDEIKIINSANEMIEVSLFDENPNSHHIFVHDKSSVVKVTFNLQFIQEDAVFRKFITKRLNRASAIIQVPKNKNITILGTNIDIISKNYNGNLAIYIDKGYINLNNVQQNVAVKLFQGNVFAKASKSDIDIKSTNGNIIVDSENHQKKYQKETLKKLKKFSMTSINANIILTTQ